MNSLSVPHNKEGASWKAEQDTKVYGASSLWPWVPHSQSCTRVLMDRWAPQADGNIPSLAFICLVPDSSSLACGKRFNIRLPKLAAEQQAERVLEMIQKKKNLIKQSR